MITQDIDYSVVQVGDLVALAGRTPYGESLFRFAPYRVVEFQGTSYVALVQGVSWANLEHRAGIWVDLEALATAHPINGVRLIPQTDPVALDTWARRTGWHNALDPEEES